MNAQEFKKIHRNPAPFLFCQDLVCHAICPGILGMKVTQLPQPLSHPFALERIVRFNHGHQEWPVQSTQQPGIPAVLSPSNLQNMTKSLAMEG